MRRSVFFLISCLLVTMLYANPVTLEQARQTAADFLASQSKGGRRAPAQIVSQQTVLNAVDASGNPYLYAFNTGGNAGYVIVSGDDRTVAVLGYSYNGSFDNQSMPDNMRAWLQGYVDEMMWLQQNGVQMVKKQPDNNTHRSGTAVKTAVAPLLTTTWNQGAPYNDKCPYYKQTTNGYSYSLNYSDGYVHCATGCVATAMAQVMNYHQWPERATKSTASYKWSRAKKTISSLEPVDFDWANMQNHYDGDETDAQNTAVATLMKHCGYSVQMNYGKESGSTTTNVANALTEYFNYNTTTTFVDRSSYTYSNWIELIYHELAEKRPVVYGGQSSGGGHEFVIDGYQTEDYFHVNWGWGGMSDSYFKLAALDPDAQGIGGSSSTDGFHYGQDAVVGVQKPSEDGGNGTVLDVPVTSDYELSVPSITLSKSSISLGETVNVTIRISNSGTDDYDGDIYLFYQLNGNNDIGPGSLFRIPSGGTTNCVFSFTPDETGTYTIYGSKPGSDGYIYTIGNTSRTLTVKQGSGSSNNVELTLNRVSTDRTELRGYTSDNKPIYDLMGNDFSAIIRMTNETNVNYDGMLLWKLLPSSFSGTFSFNTVDVKVSPNSFIDVPISEMNLDMNESYYSLCFCYVKNNAYTNYWDSYYYMNPTVITYAADGTKNYSIGSESVTVSPEALAVDLTGCGITSVVPNNNPNCLYIIGSDDTAPAGAANLIRHTSSGYAASSISLTDGYNFYSPVDFTADEITFTYTHTSPADRVNGWNTIILPYDVSEVTADDVTIDWFHSSGDMGKNFWLKSFTSDEANKVYFDFTDEMKANTPYIVAFPGGEWGPKWNMFEKTIKFIGRNKLVSNSSVLAVTTGNNYRFIGSTVEDHSGNIYSLNADGNKFVQNVNNGSGAFRAYFKPGTFDYTVSSLAIGSEPNHPTGIKETTIESGVTGECYNLNGQRVKQPIKGINIMNGKKFVVK